uniref:TM2 domain-containing protein n=1 Tax=Sexangularia sp. CB-2014 TaxID=1486929 RepID=A0A7S1YJW2_9EUKA|mmetsp:Transcript_6508/g.21077  ORF Transcript_6508/g.21077 Transcript_6508/m.21077 type:complete len:120 (+) Transcript_6508:76-435(+)
MPGTSQVTALLLSIFLGFFGAERFYLGHVETAVVKLLLLFLFYCVNYCMRCSFPDATPEDIEGQGEDFDAEAAEAKAAVKAVSICYAFCFVVWWWLLDIILILAKELEPTSGAYTDAFT